MKKETKIQVKGELHTVQSEIHKLQYHLVGLDNEKRKTKKQQLQELQDMKKKLISYL
ncbi:hypothetical protein [Bacillus cereus group sp. N21]|uniref:hypothetical protein n=1 Tax=Bacillus cereus group sp. N21 TaxID=2794591 RepID=UPI0018F530D2|nr:hypothetical protein [Bacillus cereus group sp. N21]MBJ8031983.1 hypothetical protein [Bacillus cereus group sp. N21]